MPSHEEQPQDHSSSHGGLKWCCVPGRRLVVPEVYDLMGRVEDVLVSAQSVPVRQACASALMQFLLDYPVGPKRLAQHLHHLLANLAYEHEEGRLAALDMLQVDRTSYGPLLSCCVGFQVI